jgi:hypothetical protein
LEGVSEIKVTFRDISKKKYKFNMTKVTILKSSVHQDFFDILDRQKEFCFESDNSRYRSYFTKMNVGETEELIIKLQMIQINKELNKELASC